MRTQHRKKLQTEEVSSQSGTRGYLKKQAIKVYILSCVTVKFMPHHLSHINKRLSVNKWLAYVSEVRGTSQTDLSLSQVRRE